MPKERINRQITAREVRLIGSDGQQIGIVDLRTALATAEQEDLDLVEIAPTAKPPVCKIMSFGKYYYQKEKGVREAKKKQHVVQLKEIKMGPNTEEHDYEFKKKNALKFLKQHNKVKFTIRFKGRQITHKEIGYKLLEKLQEDLKDFAEIDSPPASEMRTISMIMAPKKDIDKEESEKENSGSTE